MRSKNEDFLKQLYKEAYNIGAIFHLTKFKTEELEQKVAEVRRKFKVCISVFLLVMKSVMSLNFIDLILIDFNLSYVSFFFFFFRKVTPINQKKNQFFFRGWP